MTQKQQGNTATAKNANAALAGRPKNLKKGLGKFLGFLRPYRAWIIVAIIFAVSATVLSVIGPNLLKDITNLISSAMESFKNAIDNSFPTYNAFLNIDKILTIGAILAGFYILSAIFNYIQGYIMTGVTQKVSKNLRKNISVKINKLPLNYFDKTSTGDVLSRVTNDVDTIASTLSQSFVSLISSVALLIGSVVMMFVNSWILAIVAILSTVLGFAAMGFIIKKSQKYFLMQQATLGALNGHIEETYSGHNVVKVFNAEERVNQNFDKLNGSLYKSAWKSQFYSGLMGPLMGFIGDFSYVAVCVVGGILAFNGIISFGTIVAFMIYIRLFMQPLRQLAQAATNFQGAAAASERVFEFLGEQEMQDESVKSLQVSNIKGNVKFNNVSFGYNSKKIIINNFTTEAKAGQKIAIVGPTGAGKTTIVNLLMRFYEVNKGEILIDGYNINDMKREQVHDLFAMVLQDSWLFGGTIYENIVYNLNNVTPAMVEEACNAAGIHHFIKTLPEGYNTVMTEGSSLSAGQKQLITIARAMIKNSPLLILDEATSSVDTRTEVIIANAMDKLMQGKTSFVIAHRLSTILNADTILVMKDGDIIESGTHKALIEKKGFYADLYNSQFEAV